MKPTTINTKAHELFETDIVSARVEELQKAAQERHETTVDGITDKLRKSYDVAKNENNPNAMTAAAMGEAKLHGLLIDRSKVETSNFKDMTNEEIEEVMRQDEIEWIRLDGREYLTRRITHLQDILNIYDAGQFESYAAGEIQAVTH